VHRLSLSSSSSATSAKKALFTEDGHRSEALGEISLNTLNSAASVASASSPPPRDCTPHGAGKQCTEAPRSVLRRRTPGQAAGSTGGHISFNPAQTNFDPSPSSLVKHSPRPPRWPAAQSPWLHRGLEQSDDELHTAIPRWEATPKVAGVHSDLPHASRSHRTPAAADSTRTVQDELLASKFEARIQICCGGPRRSPCGKCCDCDL
jgi:hypothetical protein